ncbi:hypothetical protein V4C53_38515 [Paraburkholderia azotifigens]|uniref:hypothetical protein n=1 Tax=Paraburkholderia azotifigens TaxID=2057004 RepID=UPI003175E4AF
MNTAQRIKAAAMRMRDAGVIIDSEADADRLDIDERSLEGIPDERVFSLEGESAANLISAAQAYAEGVPFDEALAFVVEGYLDNTKKARCARRKPCAKPSTPNSGVVLAKSRALKPTALLARPSSIC